MMLIAEHRTLYTLSRQDRKRFLFLQFAEQYAE